ncbi:ABC transporter permease [Bacillus sp. Marseille-P3661]|uniref:ABC transporter permease n=1 Tax=Bacillus sp. Marseille-P3661 TaxID=1936234 RepID=UPI000C855517|nr:ABC transporter permease [Bacillus sp. Marseille-P3661]
MIDVMDLWKKRFQLFVKDTQRYLKLIFNDHFKFVILFAVGGGAFYYQQWLETLPQAFPAAWVIAIIVGFVLTQSPIQTFLKEADLVFLLPIETKLKPYLRKSISVSYLVQCYLLILVIAVLTPLYLHQQGSTFSKLLVITFVLLIVKAINIMLKWYNQFYTDFRTKFTDQVLRMAINILLTYFLFSGAPYYFALVLLIIMVGLMFYFYHATKNKGLKWESLIDIESQRMMTFYRIANMFTDVPKLKDRVKRRAWLNWITSKIPFEQRSAFLFLYYRTFTRSSDYLGIYVRLLIIGGILLYFLPLGYVKIALVILFTYLSGFQLLSLFRHHTMKIWVDLYPISEQIRKRNFLTMLFQLLLVKSLLFALVLLISGDIMLAFLGFGVGILFSYIFVYTYINNKVTT